MLASGAAVAQLFTVTRPSATTRTTRPWSSSSPAVLLLPAGAARAHAARPSACPTGLRRRYPVVASRSSTSAATRSPCSQRRRAPSLVRTTTWRTATVQLAARRPRRVTLVVAVQPLLSAPMVVLLARGRSLRDDRHLQLPRPLDRARAGRARRRRRLPLGAEPVARAVRARRRSSSCTARSACRCSRPRPASTPRPASSTRATSPPRSRASSARAQRFERPLSLLMADLDLLREVNNTYGHLAGDAVLQEIARGAPRRAPPLRRAGPLRRRGVRDPPARDRRPSEARGDRRADPPRRRGPRRSTSRPRRSRSASTISIGVAAFPRTQPTRDDLVHQADVAVYRAKVQGRNRVVRAGGELHSLGRAGTTPRQAAGRRAPTAGLRTAPHGRAALDWSALPASSPAPPACCSAAASTCRHAGRRRHRGPRPGARATGRPGSGSGDRRRRCSRAPRSSGRASRSRSQPPPASSSGGERVHRRRRLAFDIGTQTLAVARRQPGLRRSPASRPRAQAALLPPVSLPGVATSRSRPPLPWRWQLALAGTRRSRAPRALPWAAVLQHRRRGAARRRRGDRLQPPPGSGRLALIAVPLLLARATHDRRRLPAPAASPTSCRHIERSRRGPARLARERGAAGALHRADEALTTADRPARDCGATRARCSGSRSPSGPAAASRRRSSTCSATLRSSTTSASWPFPTRCCSSTRSSRTRTGSSSATTPGRARSSSSRLAYLSDAVPAIRHHHERYDGLGYPDGLPARRSRSARASSTWPRRRCSILQNADARPPDARADDHRRARGAAPAPSSARAAWMRWQLDGDPANAGLLGRGFDSDRAPGLAEPAAAPRNGSASHTMTCSSGASVTAVLGLLASGPSCSSICPPRRSVARSIASIPMP